MAGRQLTGVIVVAKRKNKLRRPYVEPKQPTKCKGCVWENWDGVKQFCSRQQCVKKGNTS